MCVSFFNFNCIENEHELDKYSILKTRKTAKDLVTRLTQDGVPCELLSGELEVTQRASVIKRFREGLTKILVTTNVTARGTPFVELYKFLSNFC